MDNIKYVFYDGVIDGIINSFHFRIHSSANITITLSNNIRYVNKLQKDMFISKSILNCCFVNPNLENLYQTKMEYENILSDLSEFITNQNNLMLLYYNYFGN